MLTEHSINAFADHLTLNGASPNTCRAYVSDLRGALAVIGNQPDWPSTQMALARYLNDTRADAAPKTTQRRLGTFRSWAAWSGQVGFLAAYKPPTPAPANPHPIPEGIDGVIDMIASTRNPIHRALVALTGLMGLRVNEAITVTYEDFDLVNMELRVRGKGDKTRSVPISGLAWKFIRRAHENAVSRGKLASMGGGVLVPLSNRGARAAITRHARNAGISVRVASHDMRSTALTAAYQHSKDLRAVQEIAGHADAKTTQGYTGVTSAARRAAMEFV